MKKVGGLVVAALLATGCTEAVKPAPPPPVVDPAKMMEGSAKPAMPDAAPADGTKVETTPADTTTPPVEKAPESTDPATPTPEPEKKN